MNASRTGSAAGTGSRAPGKKPCTREQAQCRRPRLHCPGFSSSTTIFRDERGAFYASYHRLRFQGLTGDAGEFVQENHSSSCRNVLRGLHYQIEQPDVIVNAAAYTAVDRAESGCSSAMLVNARAPRLLAEAAEKLGAWLLHYSTDYVFDGSKRGAYHEDDEPNPLNAYGRSKFAGEQAIMSAVSRHLIFGTSWLYGNHGDNFLRAMLELGAGRDEFAVVADQQGAPTWHRLVAEATAIALGQLRFAADASSVSGIYHLTCSGKASWFEFAQAIFDAYEPSRRPTLEPLMTEQYAAKTLRPLNSVLANEKIRATFGIVMPSWRSALLLCASEARAFAAVRPGRRG